MTRRILLGMLWLLAARCVGAESPFGVQAVFDADTAAQRIVRVSLEVPEGHYVYAESVAVEAPDGPPLDQLDFPEPTRTFDPFTESQVDVYKENTTFTYLVPTNAQAPSSLDVRFQGCSSTLCFLPETRSVSVAQRPDAVAEAPDRRDASAGPDTDGWRSLAGRFRVAGTAAGYVEPEAFIAFLDRAERGGTPDDPFRSAFEEKGAWLLVVLILLGGLGLNLTPCVLPMIPVNIAIIGAGAHAGSRRRGFALGSAYGAGIAVVYGVLGLVVMFTGSQFGRLNSSPWFNLGVAVVFLWLALAMFDVFTIDFSRFQKTPGAQGKKRGGYVTALVLGGVAALLAGACVAPVVIWVLLLATDLYARGNAAGLLLPFLLGVGMALPWPFAGAGLSFLPKPGAWMNVVKKVFGVIILVVAVWYGVLGASLLMDRFGLAGKPGTQTEDVPGHEGWTTSLEQGMKRALQQNEPVLIDFWATWCKNCLKMEKTTFRDAAVRKRLEAYVKVKFQAEDLGDPAVKEVLDYFDAVGLPTYVVMEPR